MNRDDKLIFEAYQQIDEAGFGDRMAARAKGFFQGAKPLSRLGGFAARQLGGVIGGPEGDRIKQAGQDIKTSADRAGAKAKIDSIIQSHTKDINNLSNAIIDDLNKLKLNSTGVTPDTIAKNMINAVTTATSSSITSSSGAPITADAPSGSEVLNFQPKGAKKPQNYKKDTTGWYIDQKGGPWRHLNDATKQQLEQEWRRTHP